MSSRGCTFRQCTIGCVCAIRVAGIDGAHDARHQHHRNHGQVVEIDGTLLKISSFDSYRWTVLENYDGMFGKVMMVIAAFVRTQSSGGQRGDNGGTTAVPREWIFLIKFPSKDLSGEI